MNGVSCLFSLRMQDCVACQRISLEPPVNLSVSISRRLRGFEQCPDFAKQPLQFDWFGVVLVASGLERLISICGHGMRSERDDGNLAQFGCALDPARRLPAVKH